MIRRVLRTAFQHLYDNITDRGDRAFEDAESQNRAAANDDLVGAQVRPGRSEAESLDDRARAIAFRGPPADVPMAREGNMIRMDLLQRTLEVEADIVTFALLYFGVTPSEVESRVLAMRCVKDLHGVDERIADGAEVGHG